MLATKTLFSLSATLVATVMAAQVNAQTIIVDGVTYQAVPSAGSTYVAPAAPVAPSALPATRVVPVQVAVSAPVSVPVYAPAPVYAATPVFEPQVTVSAANVVVPLIFAAAGLWAINDWYGGRRAYHGNHQPVRPVYHRHQ